MRRVREVIVVEGRYDKNALRQVVDATVVETRGFGIFNDRERLALLRRLAEERGLILLTDSDGAGFVIRNFLKGAIPKDRLKQAYIPDVYGKERRKAAPGREGKLSGPGLPPRTGRDYGCVYPRTGRRPGRPGTRRGRHDGFRHIQLCRTSNPTDHHTWRTPQSTLTIFPADSGQWPAYITGSPTDSLLSAYHYRHICRRQRPD